MRRCRTGLFFLLASDALFFVVLGMFWSARQSGFHLNPETHQFVSDWQRVSMPTILYLNTAVLMLSGLAAELARRRIFHELDALEEWLGLGQPALDRARPWLGVTLGLGVVFLAGQWVAWRQLVAAGTMTALFGLIVGLHALHLIVGALALAACLLGLGRMKKMELRQIAVDGAVWFWNVCGVVWGLMFLGLMVGW